MWFTFRPKIAVILQAPAGNPIEYRLRSGHAAADSECEAVQGAGGALLRNGFRVKPAVKGRVVLPPDPGSFINKGAIGGGYGTAGPTSLHALARLD